MEGGDIQARSNPTTKDNKDELSSTDYAMCGNQCNFYVIMTALIMSLVMDHVNQ